MLESRTVAKSVVQAKRGTKQTCKNETCGSRYYDLRRTPPACPYCGTFCDTPAIIRIDFETLGKYQPPRFRKRVEPAAPLTEVLKTDANDADATEEQADKEPALLSSAEDLLIDDDDEVEAPVESAGELA